MKPPTKPVAQRPALLEASEYIGMPLTIPVAYLLAGIVSYLGYRVGTLTVGGAVAACAVGGTIFGFGGLPWAVLLVLFFVSSSALSFAKSSDTRKLKASETFEKGGKRDAAQVLANGGIAALLSLFSPLATPLLFVGYIGALAAATADTWATEIGVLSNRSPLLITTGKPVPAGTSGGITPLGTGASAAGALCIGLAACVLAVIPVFGLPSDLAARLPTLLAAGFTGGLAGSLADSVLGATTQAAYFCPQCQVPTESSVHKCGTRTQHTKGLPIVNNDVVNLIATAVGATVGAVVWLVF